MTIKEANIIKFPKENKIMNLNPQDTGKLKAGPNAFVDFQLFVLPQQIINGEAIPDPEPLASEVISIPVKRSLQEAIINLGGELVEG